MVFAGGGRGHAPEAGGASGEAVFYQGADAGVLNECGFFVELCFHVVFVVLLFCFGGYFVRKSVMASVVVSRVVMRLSRR